MFTFKYDTLVENNTSSREIEIDKHFSVRWDLGSKRFEIINNDLKKIEKIDLDNKIIGIVRLNNYLILTLSKDNIFNIWNLKGQKRATYQEHKNEILGIEFFEEKEDSYILSISKDEGIKFWNVRGNELYKVDSKIQTLKDIQIIDTQFQLIDADNLYVYELFSGEKIATFKSQKKFISENRVLNTKKRLTNDGAIKLWDEDDNKIKELNFHFDFDNLVETVNNKMIILTNESSIIILNEKGETESDYTPTSEIIKSFKKFIYGRSRLRHMLIYKNKIQKFPHLYNPYEKDKIAEDEIANQNLVKILEEDVDTKFIWDFFNRPIFRIIKNLLKEEEKESIIYENIFNTSIESITEEINNSNKKITELQSSSKFNMIITIIAFVIAMGVGIGVNPLGFGILIISFFTFMSITSKNSEISTLRDTIKKLESQINTIKVVYPEMNRFINDIKTYRESLINQIPKNKNEDIFNGKKVKEIMNKLINSTINDTAMEYCGLLESDIKHQDKKAIILNEGSLLQANKSKIEPHNLYSFWGTEKGDILFAVQYMQYIFLTEDKIDIFNAHYDFIQNKFIRKESQSFYYKDVTNISKKEVERKLLGNDKETSATEITLKVSSGDSINFTIFNKDTLKGLEGLTDSKISVKQESDDKKTDPIVELKNQVEEIKNSEEYDNEEDRAEELEGLMESIKELEENKINENVNFSDDEVNKAIQNIRTQIKKHKN